MSTSRIQAILATAALFGATAQPDPRDRAGNDARAPEPDQVQSTRLAKAQLKRDTKGSKRLADRRSGGWRSAPGGSCGAVCPSKRRWEDRQPCTLHVGHEGEHMHRLDRWSWKHWPADEQVA